MNLLQNIISLLTSILIMLPTIGININTHICGQTEDVSKSLIIPGILSPEECDKCHNVVVVKSCCSDKKDKVDHESTSNEDKRNCCKDVLEYTNFEYLMIAPYATGIDFSSTSFIVNESYSYFKIEDSASKTINLLTRLRPYVIDIVSFKCSYLI